MRSGLLAALVLSGLGGGDAPPLPGSPRLPRLRVPPPPVPDDDPVLVEKRRKAQEKRDRRAAKRRAAGGGS